MNQNPVYFSVEEYHVQGGSSATKQKYFQTGFGSVRRARIHSAPDTASVFRKPLQCRGGKNWQIDSGGEDGCGRCSARSLSGSSSSR